MKACLLFSRTSSNRAAKEKKTKVKTEPSGEKSSENSNDKENDTRTDTAETKPNIHELSKAPKLPVKVTCKAQDQAREIITSLLSNEEDEVDVSMSGFGKRIKKSLDANDQEKCLMEIGDVEIDTYEQQGLKKIPAVQYHGQMLQMSLITLFPCKLT